MSGTFVVVEGPDGAGKTTLVLELCNRLTAGGERVTQVREPGGTPSAEVLRDLILHQADRAWTDAAELFLILAARAELVQQVIRPALADGSVVVSDRFGLSTIAYQSVGRGLPRAEVDGAIRLATGGLQPDLTIVLDVNPEEGRRRQAVAGKSPDRIERASDEMHQRVAEFYRGLRGPGFAHVDANRAPGEVVQQAMSFIERYLAEHRGAAQG